jgi:hypothetical protein
MALNRAIETTISPSCTTTVRWSDCLEENEVLRGVDYRDDLNDADSQANNRVSAFRL